jgi:hypothetical protein
VQGGQMESGTELLQVDSNSPLSDLERLKAKNALVSCTLEEEGERL